VDLVGTTPYGQHHRNAGTTLLGGNMTDTRTIPLSTIIVTLLWALVFCILSAGWICMAAGAIHVAQMLGFTAGPLSAVAVTATIWGLALRTQALIRTLHGIETSAPSYGLRGIPEGPG
jgi:hypothetical protein